MADSPATSTPVTDQLEPNQDNIDTNPNPTPSVKPETKTVVPAPEPPTTKPDCKRCPCHDGDSKKRNRKANKRPSSASSSDSDDDSENSSSSSSDDNNSADESETSLTTSETETDKKKQRQRNKSKAKKAQGVRRRKTRRRQDIESESDREDEADDPPSGGKRLKQVKAILKNKKAEADFTESSEDQQEDSDSTESDEVALLAKEVAALKTQLADVRRNNKTRGKRNTSDRQDSRKGNSRKAKNKRTATKVAFKRVDQLWDNSIHNYKLSETADEPDTNEYDQYIFTVRRKFNWENRYSSTMVDIKSKPLREALSKIMHGVKGVSLVQETSAVDPNMLFLYLEETRQYMKNMKQLAKAEKKKKARKIAATKAAHLKVMVKYLDTDFAETKRTLYPLLESNMITFDYVWALFKPNTIAYTSTYGDQDEPRAFKIEYAQRETSFMRGEWYAIEGRYLEYDGKSFGLGSMDVTVDAFKGTRKITSLACYPLKYHREADELRAKLLERGKKFVSLRGMNYRFHHGMAFVKRKRAVVKVNINGRVMLDPVIFRRINPNYQISTLSPKDDDLESDESDDDSIGGGCECLEDNQDQDADVPKYKYKVVEDEDCKPRVVAVEVDENGNVIQKEKMDQVQNDSDRAFTEEELIISCPVTLGFAFSEKLWLEFCISGISDIQWNEKAFDSLVLPENQKSIVKALVSSHTFNDAQSIDDVIQGKGKGLVSVLHGPPGTGKTLTAEGIAELLKRPLYIVSVGELGMDSRTLETELNKILDIAHSWGAVLLLDEADIFLEKRTIQDIHRNALVSIFLRLLEYFQGILFLTTNRVETFDDAFQSRIHVALRYGDLTPKAKRSVWKMFLEKVQEKQEQRLQMAQFSEKDFDALARHNLNGRQIKNSVRTAQALALYENTPISMDHIKRVLEVAETFDQDLRGGTGYLDAMRSYT